MAAAEESLKPERLRYEQHRLEWALHHSNEFVLLFGDADVEFFSDYESALRAGLHKYGFNASFLIQEVCAREPVFFIY